MKLGVISDSHGHTTYTQNGLRMLQQFSVDTIVHCGDIGSTEIPRLFEGYDAHFVFGNVDQNEEDLIDAIQIAGQTCWSRFGQLELAGRRIAFLHGDDTTALENAIASQSWDLVCYGHTHKAEYHLVGKSLVLNPGAVFRARPHSVAVVDLLSLEVSILPCD